MTRSHARSPKGQRAYCENSLTRGTRVSTIGALGTEGLLTAFCYKGTMTGFLFANRSRTILSSCINLL